jgi:dipeptidyl-peptidase-4
METPSYPRLLARTRNFTLGRPRQIATAGDRVTFVRSASGTDPLGLLWALDPDGGERLLVDPRALLGQVGEELTDDERARRERSRETGSGIVAYALDDNGRVAAFSLSGRLVAVDVASGSVTELRSAGAAIDPRPDPTGRLVAYVTGGQLHVVGEDFPDKIIAGEPDVSWGVAEFVAAEDMGRDRGHWWAPDGTRLLAARVDERPLQRWWIADPGQPDRPPRSVAYPAAGTPNADVQVAMFDLEGSAVPVEWDRVALPYLLRAGWNKLYPWVLVMTRDQRRQELLRVDATDGTTSTVLADEDPIWIEVVSGVPSWTADGRVVRTMDDADSRRLVIGDDIVTPPGVQVTRIVHAGNMVVFTGTDEPTERHVYLVDISSQRVERLTTDHGVHDAVASDDLLAIISAGPSSPGLNTTVRRMEDPRTPVAAIKAISEVPPVRPVMTLLRSGERELRTALLLPREEVRPEGPLPILLDPYGGPHAQRVLASEAAYLQSQWFADQGFAVVICDGRGTPARGPAWERAIHLDVAGPVLDDQIDALHDVANRHPGELDLGRVAIRGWSFGGYLAALAVLRRPDVIHAAIAGAPVTDFRLYDTFYSERYLGLPTADPDPYERCCLIAEASRLERPLLLIHGLADDNVVVGHTLQFSTALLTAGRPHSVLPLSGITHMTPQEDVAENLLLLQVRFLKDSLGQATPA